MKKRFRPNLPVLLMAVLVSLLLKASAEGQQIRPSVSKTKAGLVTDISIIQLIAVPKAFDGKRVRVHGFAEIEYEGNALYLHEEDRKYRIDKNSLALDVPLELIRKAKGLRHNYVIIEGTFSAANQGHFSTRSGGITKITGFEIAATN